MKKNYLCVEEVMLSRLQNAEFISLLQRAITLLPRKQSSGGEDGQPSVQGLDTQAETEGEISDSMYIDDELVERLQSILDQLSDLTLESRSELQSKELEQIDRDRDVLLGFVFKTMGQAAILPLETQRKAGLVLDNELGVYAGTGELPQTKETAVVRGMIKDSKKTDVAEAISTLGLTPIFAELERLNDLFEKTEIARNNAVAPRRTEAKTKELRAEATLIYYEIVDRAFAANLLHGNEETKSYITNLNEEIVKAEAKVKRRLGKKKGEDPEDEDKKDEEETPDTTDMTSTGENPSTDDKPSTEPGETEDPGTTTPPDETTEPDEETPSEDDTTTGGEDDNSDRPVVQ